MADKVRIQVTPTVSTTPAYTAKDQVGGLMEFTNAVASSGGTGVLMAVQVEDKGQQMAGLDLLLFDRSITVGSDNAIFNPSDADLAFCVGVVPLLASDYADLSTNSVASRSPHLAFKANGTSLYGVLVTRSTPTYTSTSDIVVAATILRD